MKIKAFTAVEILIVIAVIGVLMSISMPVLRSVRQQGRLVVCSSNLRQLYIALTIYEKDNDSFPYGFYDKAGGLSGPIPPGKYAGESRDPKGLWWFNFLEEIIGGNLDKGSVLWCPARSVQGPFPNPNILCGNYGVNQAICKNTPPLGGEFVGEPLNLSSIKRSPQTILIMDSGYALISWRAATESAGTLFGYSKRKGSFYIPGMKINKTRSIEPGAEIDAIDGRHPSKTVNIAFADGQLSSVKSDQLFVEKDANSAPLWSPR